MPYVHILLRFLLFLIAPLFLLNFESRGNARGAISKLPWHPVVLRVFALRNDSTGEREIQVNQLDSWIVRESVRFSSESERGFDQQLWLLIDREKSASFKYLVRHVSLWHRFVLSNLLIDREREREGILHVFVLLKSAKSDSYASSSSGADKSPDSKDPWCLNFYAYKATFRQSIYSPFGLLLLNNQPSSDQFSRGKLIDAYRFLHKEKDMERGFSCSGNPIGK